MSAPDLLEAAGKLLQTLNLEASCWIQSGGLHRVSTFYFPEERCPACALRAAIKAEEERRAAEHARLVRFAHCVGCDGYEDPMMCDGCAARGGTGEGKP